MASPRTEQLRRLMGVHELSRDAAVALDATDPLARFRDRFVFAGDEDLIYLDGNSLGRLPRDTPARLAEVVQQQWGERLIRSWSEGWMELPRVLGDRLGDRLLGAAPGQVAVARLRDGVLLQAGKPGAGRAADDYLHRRLGRAGAPAPDAHRLAASECSVPRIPR